MFKPRWLGITVTIMFLFSHDVLGAGNFKRPVVMGSVVGVKGTVLVDHQPVMVREAVFSGEEVSTGAASGAFLNLHGTVAIIVDNSEMTLAGSGDATTISLKKGSLEIRSGNSQPARVYVGKATVIVKSEGGFPSICRIASTDASSIIFADKGHVEIHGKGAPIIVQPGESVRLEAGLPQASGTLAGKVSAEIPMAQIRHGGTGTPNTLKISDPVYLDDLVETVENGRVRIGLLDGSFVNVGARSQMYIRKHDAQSQQTGLELKLGTLRSEVVKLTKGGKFETRTPTAVIGVVGTVWVAQATTQDTKVWSVTGDVTVSNVDPNVPGTVVLHTGQFTDVGLGLPPTAPSLAPTGQVSTEMDHTAIEGGGITGATGGIQAGTIGGHAVTSAGGFNVLALGATGAAAVAGGMAIHETTLTHSGSLDTATSLANAAAAANQALTSATGAQNAASQALAATQQANDLATTTLNEINGILSGCGCVSPSGP